MAIKYSQTLLCIDFWFLLLCLTSLVLSTKDNTYKHESGIEYKKQCIQTHQLKRCFAPLAWFGNRYTQTKPAINSKVQSCLGDASLITMKPVLLSWSSFITMKPVLLPWRSRYHEGSFVVMKPVSLSCYYEDLVAMKAVLLSWSQSCYHYFRQLHYHEPSIITMKPVLFR